MKQESLGENLIILKKSMKEDYIEMRMAIYSVWNKTNISTQSFYTYYKTQSADTYPEKELGDLQNLSFSPLLSLSPTAP